MSKNVGFVCCELTMVMSAGFKAFLDNMEDRAWHALGYAAAPLRARVIGVTSKPLQNKL